MSNILDAKSTTLDEWMGWLRSQPEALFWQSSFPTEAHRDDFYADLERWTERDLRLLLRCFIIRTGSNPVDQFGAEYTLQRLKEGHLTLEQCSEHERRHLRFLADDAFPVWEGLHWVLDLLPAQPRRALDVLHAFLFARAHHLKDNHLYGIYDAQTLIRTCYIGQPTSSPQASAVLDAMTWREVEFLCGVLFDHMGYAVEVTARSDDDGVDVLATRDGPGVRDKVVVSAKHRKSKVKKADWRELLGTVDDKKAARGILITTGPVESGVLAKAKQDHRTEVIQRPELLSLLNEHVGTNWWQIADRLMAEL